VALVEDGVLVELWVERQAARALHGNIYLGRVRNILPGMQAAFVDLGMEKDGFLYVEDAPGPRRPPPEEEAGASPAPAGGRIEERVREGQALLVQIVKDPIAGKGPRITAHLALPGRLLVFLPGFDHVGVSRRIGPEEERARLRLELAALRDRLAMPGGLILRTAAAKAAAEALEGDAHELLAAWSEVEKRRLEPAPVLVHREAGAVERAVRELLREGVDELVADSDEAFDESRRALQRLPEASAALTRHAGPEPLFEARGLETQIARALRPRVWLKSGGHIVVHPTEALVAIDVNTGKFVGRSDFEETILRTNLEAVREIVRQIRLRDLGGLIVIDFIDMQRPESREAVRQALADELRRDRARSRVLPLSEFGLVEITRQRNGPSLDRVLLRPCPACQGTGWVRSDETVASGLVREARRLRRGAGKVRAIRARLAPGLAARLEARRGDLARAIGLETADRLRLDPDPDLGPDDCVTTLDEADA
jgi:ribonuclease G